MYGDGRLVSSVVAYESDKRSQTCQNLEPFLESGVDANHR